MRRAPSSLSAALAPWWRDLAAVAVPAICLGCDGAADAGDWEPLLCPACSRGLSRWERAAPAPALVDRSFAHLLLEGAARSLVHALKYGGCLRAGRELGRRMAGSEPGRRLGPGSDLLVPVPLHWRRRWRRGHNQARVIARGMAVAWGVDGPRMLSGALRRRRSTPPQVGLSGARRRHNLAGAFAPGWRSGEVRGARVLLVDDVITTGATAAAAARELRRAGASRIFLYAAAWAR